MNTDAEKMFNMCEITAKTYSTMLLAELINDARGVDSTRQMINVNKMLEHLKNQIKIAVLLQDNN